MNLNIIESNTQEKVNKILAIDNETETETETKKPSFNLPDTSETKKGFNLELKKTDKTLADLKKEKSNLQETATIEKFAQVETLLTKMESIDTTFINFLDNQKENLEVLNNFAKLQDNIETYFQSIIKNQSSILNAINSLHAKELKKPETETEKDIEKETEKPETKLKKGINTIDGFFQAFQKNFDGNFLGSKELTSETKPIFQALIQAIDNTSADAIVDSIKAFKSNFTKSNSGKELNAKRSNKKFLAAMVKTIESLTEKDLTSESKQNSETIDKQYFVKAFNTDKKTISHIGKVVADYGKIDTEVKAKITANIYSLNADTEKKDIDIFLEWLTRFIEE